MNKMYGGLFQRRPGGLILYRNMWVMDLKAGFFVVVQESLWSESETATAPISQEQPFAKFYPSAEEAVAEADKQYEHSLKAGFRPIGESY
jgi:hypothetical protein